MPITRGLKIPGAAWNPVPVTRLTMGIFFETTLLPGSPGPTAHTGWLDTGAPFCFLPAYLRTRGLVFHATGIRTMALGGVLCDIVTVKTWLDDASGAAVGPFNMLAKLALVSTRSRSADPILIGVEFLQYHRAHFQVDFAQQGNGELRI